MKIDECLCGINQIVEVLDEIEPSIAKDLSYILSELEDGIINLSQDIALVRKLLENMQEEAKLRIALDYMVEHYGV